MTIYLLLFVDDIHIFEKSNQSITIVLKRPLDCLTLFSGMEVNKDKYIIYFSKNTRNTDLFSSNINLTFRFFPLKYLGIPLTYGLL